MNLMDLLDDVGGASSVSKMGEGLGLDAESTSSLVAALAPALMQGFQKQTESPDGLASLQQALAGGGHQKYLDDPDLIASAATTADGNNILGHLFGTKDVSRNVAAQAAQSTGLQDMLIKKALPMLAGITMAAMSKKSNAGADANPDLGSLLGGIDWGDIGVDDMLNMAKKFF